MHDSAGDCDGEGPGDYLKYLRRRQYRWQNNMTYLRHHGLWQAAIDDKLIGYLYARSVGVATPSVLFCDPRGYSALPLEWPASWGCCFVLKPLFGYNDFGILLIENGVDRFSGTRLRGRRDVIEHFRRSRPNYERKMTEQTIYVETVVRADPAEFAHNATPPDYKFFTFGRTIGTVAILEGRKVASACMAWVTESFVRTDYHGCVCSKPGLCNYGHCDSSRPTRPRQWDELVRVASRLGDLIGVHMRIDLYASSCVPAHALDTAYMH